jgi:hypothetical protein
VRIQIEPTEKMVEVDGVPCRVWNGVTEKGVQVFLFVHRVAVAVEDDSAELDAALREVSEPKTLRRG